MSVVERLLKEQKDREARRNEVFAAAKALPLEDRCEVAVAVIAQLPAEDLHRVVTQLIRHVEKQAEQTEVATKPAPTAELPKVSPAPGTTPPHVAGRMILNGVVSSTAPSLSTAPKTRTTEKKTQRDFISEVITAAGRAMGTGEIGKGVIALAPELKFESIKAEVQRMRKDGFLIVEGSNGRGGLHRLATEQERTERRAVPKEHLNGVS
jgi:hypothetical protein